MNTYARQNTTVEDVTDDEDETPESFYLFGLSYFRSLFSRFYSESVTVHSTTRGVTSEEADSVKVIIVVGSEPPQSGHHRFGCHKFELQVVCVLRSKEKERDPSKFDAIRYMRHAKHAKFWKQERDDAIATKCTDDIFAELESKFSDEVCDHF